ncbi:MAG: PAS domain-containing sensor histidine kinase [Candidatus Paracaedibacteraceae bacterium]|nr:PAS domain-containing sensor histidine kinase [Candidatus Paracaedibacteraceae bacterium]
MTETGYFQRITSWMEKAIQRDILMRRAGLILSIAAILSGVATYVVLTGTDDFADKSSRVLPLIYLDVTLMLMLSVVIAKRLLEIWAERRKGTAGSKLHVQIAALFAFVAITPGIFVTVFSALFFNVGLKAWFSEPVRLALSEAKFVANAYLYERAKGIEEDAVALINELGPTIQARSRFPEQLSESLTRLTRERGVDEALILDEEGNVVGRAFLTFALEFEKALIDAFQRAKNGEMVVLSSDKDDRVRALTRLDPAGSFFLYIGKVIDPDVLRHVKQTDSAISEYERLDAQRSGLQITFILFFSLVAFLLLLAAVWAGLTVANLFVRPISRLITASDAVSQGNLEVQVEAQGSINNELGVLAEAFNRMTVQLKNQRQELINASLQIDQRRQFMEAVLSRISAGVISTDSGGVISLINRRARELLDIRDEGLVMKLADVLPEVKPLLVDLTASADGVVVSQVSIMRRGVPRILQVVLVADHSGRKKSGVILTFDDVTPLMSAQRKAAWSDVARKIAHEIKNPLTPIQLSAERLKRKYLKEIQTDPEVFQTCVDTIVRQVGQIGRLVNEFSSFARMPEPILVKDNLVNIAKNALDLQIQAHTHIEFDLSVDSNNIWVNCDAAQITQVLTNLLQNAINAVSLDEIAGKAKPDRPIIKISLRLADNKCVVSVEDNGPGLPVNGRERLTEPYYTTHSKGTGLGLAIVAKIIEDHRGRLELGDSPLGGARVLFEIPIVTK